MAEIVNNFFINTAGKSYDDDAGEYKTNVSSFCVQTITQGEVTLAFTS